MKQKETIRRIRPYDEDGYTYYPVLIVGAGESGIAMGCRLKEELGFDQFRIFDRQAGIGGTWWINRYPGVACDVPAVFYSFSFCQNPNWSAFFPPGPEIVNYLQNVCDKYQITDKISLNTDVEACRWLEDEQLWEVTLRHLVAGVGELSSKDRAKLFQEKGQTAIYSSTEVVKAKVVVSGVGGLVEPKAFPDIPGHDNFKGSMFHSARWDYNVDLKDKNVVVIGTGCSAAQFVPQLTKKYAAKSVTQLMRSPPWIVPRLAPLGSEEQYAKWMPWLMNHVPGLMQSIRSITFSVMELDFTMFGQSEYSAKQRKRIESSLLKHMKRTAPSKYHDILTPDYGVGCKRRILDTWFPSLNDPKIELTTQPLTKIHEDSVTIGPGRLYPPMDKPSSAPTEERTIPADVIILANGFDTTRWLHPMKVVGDKGQDLVKTMEERGGPQAYQGTAMDGFPNFFLVFGPNTATGHSSVILATENMVEYSLNFIKKILKGEAETVEVKREAEESYTKDLQDKLGKMIWTSGGCNNWYITGDNRWNGTVYPYSQIYFTYRCMFPKWSDWNIKYTRYGKLKRAVIAAVKISVFVSLLVGAVKARQAGLKSSDVRDFVRRSWYKTVGIARLLPQVVMSSMSS